MYTNFPDKVTIQHFLERQHEVTKYYEAFTQKGVFRELAGLINHRTLCEQEVKQEIKTSLQRIKFSKGTMEEAICRIYQALLDFNSPFK